MLTYQAMRHRTPATTTPDDVSSAIFRRIFSFFSWGVSFRAWFRISCFVSRPRTCSMTLLSNFEGSATACSPRTFMKFDNLNLGSGGGINPSWILSLSLALPFRALLSVSLVSDP